MNKLLKYSLFLLFTAFASCSSDDDGAPIVPNGHPQPGDALELTVNATDFVTDGAPDTRATDSGNTTTFKDGDRVGIIILDATNKPIYDNIPYVYNNGNWTFDSNNDEGKGGCYYDTNAETYIVYYPYSQAADGVKGVDELKGKLAPKFNQSNIEDYRASDLMVWTNNGHLASSVTTLNAELTHAFASIYLTPPTVNGVILDDDNDTPYRGSYAPGISDISDVNFTIDDAIYLPYQATDGSLQCILPAGFTTGDIRCFYTIGSKTYGNTISISGAAANTRYVSQPEIKNVTYSLGNAHVGDFYCKNSKDEGYLIPGDEASLSPEQKNACIGIVMKVEKDNSGQWKDDCEYKLKNSTIPMNTIYGYVLALYDANEGKTCQWGSSGKSVNTNTETTGFYGYKNTQTIINYDKNNEKKLQNNFPATYFATEDYENKHPAPNNSSGWFLPSAGQCKYWLNNRPTLLTQVNNVTGNNSYNWLGYYWSSSESNYFPTSHAWYLSGNVNSDLKSSSSSVRSCLAF